MTDRVKGKCVLITGAAGGLGQAMALRLLEEGATVALTDLDAGAVEALRDRLLADHPGRVFAYAHDVASEADWVRVVAAATGDMGGLSVLINNAGIGGEMAYAEADTLDNWRKVQAVNIESIMLGCKHAMPHLRGAAPASIITIS